MFVLDIGDNLSLSSEIIVRYATELEGSSRDFQLAGSTEINKQTRLLIAGFLSSTSNASAAMAGGIHPTTGEVLADDQTFTYRILDEHSSVDPQVVEDVSGSEILRDLFEGLMSQDQDGNLVPGVATAYTINDVHTG